MNTYSTFSTLGMRLPWQQYMLEIHFDCLVRANVSSSIAVEPKGRSKVEVDRCSHVLLDIADAVKPHTVHNGFNASEHIDGLDEPSMCQPVVMAWGAQASSSNSSSSREVPTPEAASKVFRHNSLKRSKLHMPPKHCWV